MKNLIICTASFHINNYDNSVRENEYYFCLKQIIRLLPNNYDLLVCDNTIKTIDDLKNHNLIKLLRDINFFILKRNIGIKNIGMGELDELIYLQNNLDFNVYNYIIYFTARRILTNPWIFEKVNNCVKDGIICNPEFLHLSSNFEFRYSECNPNLYNDMFFALKSSLMIKYSEYSKKMMEYNLNYGVGSEQNLFNFINKNNIDYEWLDCIG